MYRQRQIDRKEALSDVNYANALDYFAKKKVRGPDDKEKIDRYTETILAYITRLPS